MWLKQSSTGTFIIGPFVDNTDGVTPETELTIAQADVRLSKNGAVFAQKNETTSATHIEVGYYSVPYDATDTNTLGRLKVAITFTGTALPVWSDFMILPENVFNSLVWNTETLNVNSTTGTVSLATDNIELIAEEILKLDWTTISGEASRSVLNALRFLRNKWLVTGSTLSVKKENDTDEAWNSDLVSDASAEPIIGSDPT